MGAIQAHPKSALACSPPPATTSPSDPMSDITRILHDVEQGQPQANEELFALVYQELRKLAASKMAREAGDHTLQPTALVHEAWIRLSGNLNQEWRDRGHFFGAAAESMRRILIDRARSKQRVKHGAGWTRVDFDTLDLAIHTDDDTLLRLNDALEKFEKEDPIKAKMISLRFFAGLSIPDAGLAMGLSEATLKRFWTYSRAWLYAELNHPE